MCRARLRILYRPLRPKCGIMICRLCRTTSHMCRRRSGSGSLRISMSKEIAAVDRRLWWLIRRFVHLWICNAEPSSHCVFSFAHLASNPFLGLGLVRQQYRWMMLFQLYHEGFEERGKTATAQDDRPTEKAHRCVNQFHLYCEGQCNATGMP